MTSTLEQVRELNQRAWALCKKDAPQALALARQCQELLAHCADALPTDEFDCLKTQTYCLDVLSKPDEGLLIGLKANQLAEQIGDTYLIGSIQSILGRIYWHIDDFATAINYYRNALKLVQPGLHPDVEVSLTNGLGLVQYGLGNYDEALGYFQRCLAMAAEADLTGRADANNNIAYTLHMLGRDQEAVAYGLAGLALFEELGTTVGKMETLQSLGAIHRALGNYDEAMKFLLEGIDIARRNNSPLLEMSYVLEISRIREVQGELDEAEHEVLHALQTAVELGSLTNISLLHERLVEIYKARQDYQAALHHFEAFHAAYKQIFNEASDRRFKNLEIQHQLAITRQQADIYRELAGTDSLTSLVNRRRFLEIAEIALQRARSQSGQLALMMLDVDHFKQINDQYGHAVGDVVLATIAATLKQSLRHGDVAGRYGGEEFIILVSDLSTAQVLGVAERIRQAVVQQSMDIGHNRIQVTASLGVVSSDTTQLLPLDVMISHADQALYQAKQQGRNRVVVWRAEEHGS
jgi:diguanylate cyclase (GGDEF)-like protein